MWRLQTLEQLENEIWPEVHNSTFLMITCHALRKVPLNKLDVEDLRVMIGQNIGCRYLIPLALEKLELDFLAEGHFYKGDLFEAVINSEIIFWINNQENVKWLKRIVDKNKQILSKQLPALKRRYTVFIKQMAE